MYRHIKLFLDSRKFLCKIVIFYPTSEKVFITLYSTPHLNCIIKIWKCIFTRYCNCFVNKMDLKKWILKIICYVLPQLQLSTTFPLLTNTVIESLNSISWWQQHYRFIFVPVAMITISQIYSYISPYISLFLSRKSAWSNVTFN